MHVDHLHRKIFHAECWEFRSLCDYFWLLKINFSFIYIETMEHPLVIDGRINNHHFVPFHIKNFIAFSSGNIFH